LWLVIAVILISVFSNFGPRREIAQKYSYSEFLQNVDKGDVKSVIIDERNIQGTLKNNTKFTTYMPMADQDLLHELQKNDVEVTGKQPDQQSYLMRLFLNWFPMFLLIAVWIFFMRQMQGGGRGGPMAFGRSRARMLTEDQVKVTFADVA